MMTNQEKIDRIEEIKEESEDLRIEIDNHEFEIELLRRKRQRIIDEQSRLVESLQ